MTHNMKQFLLFILSLWIILPLQASDLNGKTKDNIATSNSVAILNSAEHIVVNDIPAKLFSFHVNNTGAYYLSAWINVPEYADKSVPVYTVYDSAHKIGTITPKKSGWQACTIDSSMPIKFAEGENHVLVTSDKNDVPDVEEIRIGMDALAVKISGENFLSYKEKAKSKALNEDNIISTSYENEIAHSSSSKNYRELTDIPVKYSFYITQRFTAGQDITLTSNSLDPHSLDLFIIGDSKTATGPIVTDSVIYRPTTLLSTGENDHMVNNTAQSLKITYNPVSPEMAQGLNWHAVGEQEAGCIPYISRIRAKITQTGLYMIYAKTRIIGSSGLVTLNVNGEKYYNDQPMYNSFWPISLSADGSSYAIMASNIGRMDPMLFIEGAKGNRILAFADGEVRNIPVMITTPKVNIANVGISNSNSLNPEGTCNIIVQKSSVSTQDAETKTRRSIAKISDIDDKSNDGIFPNPISSDGLLTIKHNTGISNISVFDMSGVLISEKEGSGSIMKVSASELRLESGNMYILNVRNNNKSASYKLMVK